MCEASASPEKELGYLCMQLLCQKSPCEIQGKNVEIHTVSRNSVCEELADQAFCH